MQKDFYRVIKTDSDIFAVKTPAGLVFCRSRKKNKKGEILVGDFIKLSDGVIQEVMPRKNRLIRPAAANVDQILLVVCCVPKPDYFLLDKAVVNCFKNGIDVIICVNKSDINDEAFLAEVQNQYTGITVICASALRGEINGIKNLLYEKFTCLAGQSAVGKSSIIKALLEGSDGGNSNADNGGNSKINDCSINNGTTDKKLKTGIRIGELSAIERGRNTTTSVEIYDVYGGLLADTPGFSLLDFQDIKSTELELYYPEFDELRNKCKYHKCTHTKEPDCAVSSAASTGLINAERYKRYLLLFEELRQRELKKFT